MYLKSYQDYDAAVGYPGRVGEFPARGLQESGLTVGYVQWHNNKYDRLKVITEIKDSNTEVIWSTEQPLNGILPGGQTKR